ncbi:MAG TPA: adenylate/guanylate cyclase domain-containing protein [Flavisolibacter sp.]|nr:adenylate/guanylate cyclase domain-containing protein [Flavisolibacter sp.]
MEGNEKHLVEFTQEGCVYVSDKQSLLDASLEAGVPLYHVCGGKAKCSTCRVLVLQGSEWLSPVNEKEAALKHQMNFPPNVRLACQTFATGGPVKLSRILKDETDIGLYVGSTAGEATQQIGEEKELALFFLDIRHFTPFIEQHLAFDVIHILRKLFINCENIIEGNGGRIIETMGDGFYATFGFTGNKQEAVEAAVQSAQSILKDLERLNEEYYQPHFNHRIEVGIGIHSGRVITGSIRLGRQQRFVAMGYAVNIAARLQALTKELDNCLVVSDEVLAQLQNKPENYATTMSDLKGVTGVCRVHCIGKPYAKSE